MDGFPSGQRGQTVNLLAPPSKVRILLHPLSDGYVHSVRYAELVQIPDICIVDDDCHSYKNLISRGGAVWKLVGLITRRS